MKPLKSMLVILMVALLFLGYSRDVFAAMSSSNYQIRWDTVSVGGGDTATSSTYQLRDAVGGQGIGHGTSSTYRLAAGYRPGIFDPVVTFETFIQYRNSQVAATALSSLTVTVTSVAGFSVGDKVLLVGDEGATQESAIGQIASMGASDITVDAWVNSGVMPAIDGSSDYLYNMNAPTLSFNTLSSTAMSTGAFGWEVTADLPSGYSVYLFEDHNLQTSGGASVITDVADGTVSVGATEYGARSSDTTLSESTFDTQDTAITSTWQQVGSRSAFAWDARDFLTLRATISGAVTAGSYSQTLTLVYVGDY
jgi:hypothetical protein